MRTLLIALCSILLLAPARSEPTLDPYEARSPSGNFVVSVKPSSMDGAGRASYTLSERGKPLWTKDLANTLWQAAVLDDGTICGFAYSNGYQGRTRGGNDVSVLLCIIIDHRGEIRTRDAHPRGHPRVMSNPPAPYEPLALGLTVDPAHDWFLVRAAGSFDNSTVRWWPYRISTGEALDEIAPDQPKTREDGLGFYREVAADLIPGTPLLLVHWYLYQPGARFAVLDARGKEVWSLSQDDEYAGLGRDFSWWKLAEQGIRQTAVRDKGFDIISYALRARVTFEVTADPAAPSGFAVKEIKRAEDVPAPKSPALAAAELAGMALEPAGVIELRAPAPSSPIDNIHDFNVDAKGRLGFIRWEQAGRPRFVLVNPDGSIALNQQLDLPEQEKAQLPIAAPVRGDRWIVVRATYENAAPTAAWWLDVGTNALTPFKEFNAGDVRALRGLSGGGVMVEGSYRDPKPVVVYDAHGQQRTAIEGVERGMMQSAAVRTDGSIAILVGVANTIECFDPQGKFVRSDDLASLLGGRPTYPSTLRADRDGGLILEDFNGSPPIYRIAADNKVTARLTPRFSDGRAFRPFGGVQVAPDGSLWTSDSHSLLRIDEQGIVNLVLGPAPAADDLGRITAVAVGANGLIYAIDARTSAVHIFDIDGARVRVCQPEAGDFPSDRGADQVSVAHDGSVWIHGRMSGMLGPGKFFGFGADGARLLPKKSSLDRITETWHFQPTGPQRWVLGYEKLWLVGEDDKPIKTVTHRPSGAWLGHVDNGAVARDGSLAVIAGPRGMGMRGPAELNIYGPAGEPVKTITLPDQWTGMRIAFNGRWAITANENELHLYDVNTDERGKFTIPEAGGPGASASKRYWSPFISPDGNEVWLHDSGSRSLTRFRLPG